MYLRVKFLTDRGTAGMENLFSETAVLAIVGGVIISPRAIIRDLVLNGFKLCDSVACKTTTDLSLHIMPGAILSVVECDARGYSDYDREQIAEDNKRRGVPI